MEKEKCNICEKPAVAKCAQCGMPLCEEHKKHGIHYRTNDPSVNCPSCKDNISRLNKKLVIYLGLALIVIFIALFFYFNSIFHFF
jgi:uncharacterized membrane protein YvbJ